MKGFILVMLALAAMLLASTFAVSATGANQCHTWRDCRTEAEWQAGWYYANNGGLSGVPGHLRHHATARHRGYDVRINTPALDYAWDAYCSRALTPFEKIIANGDCTRIPGVTSSAP